MYQTTHPLPSLTPTTLVYTFRYAFFFLLLTHYFLLLSEIRGPQHCQAQFIKTLHWHMSLNTRSRQGQFSTRPVQRRQTRVGLLLFSDRLCSKHKSMRSKTESLQYPSGLDLGVKSVWAIWLSTLQNIWSNKICYWFTAISGFFFFYDTLYVAEITHPTPKQ